ncbi:MAG: hypothetical protein ACKOT0_11825 [bacterium]
MRARAWLSVGIALVGCAALGALLGLLWVRLAPRVELFVSGGKGYPQGFQPEGYMTADGLAALLCAGAGVVVGVAVTLVVRRRVAAEDPRWAYLALALGVLLGVVGAASLWLTGVLLGTTDYEAQLAVAADGDTLVAPLRLRIPGVLLLWPIASVAVTFIVALFDWGRHALRSREPSGEGRDLGEVRDAARSVE